MNELNQSEQKLYGKWWNSIRNLNWRKLPTTQSERSFYSEREKAEAKSQAFASYDVEKNPNRSCLACNSPLKRGNAIEVIDHVRSIKDKKETRALLCMRCYRKADVLNPWDPKSLEKWQRMEKENGL